jgi:hypothetical protein
MVLPASLWARSVIISPYVRSLSTLSAEAANRRVFRHFAVPLVSSLQYRPDPARSGDPAAPERACPPNLEHALGLDPELGKRPFDCDGHDKCEIGDISHLACIPRAAKIA